MDFKEYDEKLAKLNKDIIEHKKIVAALMEERKLLWFDDEED